MTAIACTPSIEHDDMMPRTVPAPASPAPLRQQPRRKSSLDFLKKAATSGSTRIRSISNTSIRSFFAQDASITNDGDNADNAECDCNNVPGEIIIAPVLPPHLPSPLLILQLSVGLLAVLAVDRPPSTAATRAIPSRL